MKKIEKIVILFILFISIGLFFINYFNSKDRLNVIVKNGHDDILLSFNIYEDNYYTLDGEYGKFNLEVKDGKVRAIDVECPNQICVHTGWISINNPVAIICLPNNIVVMIDEK